MLSIEINVNAKKAQNFMNGKKLLLYTGKPKTLYVHWVDNRYSPLGISNNADADANCKDFGALNATTE